MGAIVSIKEAKRQLVAVSGLQNNLRHLKKYNHFLIDKFNCLFKEYINIESFKIKRTC